MVVRGDLLKKRQLESQGYVVSQMEGLENNPSMRFFDLDDGTWTLPVTIPREEKAAQVTIAYYLGLTSRQTRHCKTCDGVGRWKEQEGRREVIVRCDSCRGRGRIPGPNFGKPKYALEPPVSSEASVSLEKRSKRKRRRRARR